MKRLRAGAEKASGLLNRPTAPSDYEVLSPSSDPGPHTRDQPFSNRDIYTLVKVGRCYPVDAESRCMSGIIRPHAKAALAASRTPSHWWRLCASVSVCMLTKERAFIFSPESVLSCSGMLTSPPYCNTVVCVMCIWIVSL